MSTHSENLARELTTLANDFRDLGPRLAEIARNLEIGGQPPAEDAIAQVQSARRRFVECRDATLRLAASERFPSTPPPEELVSVGDLERLIQAISNLMAEREKQEKQRKLLQTACGVLERVLKLVHREGLDLQPLRDCQERARELKKAVDSGQEQIGMQTYQDLANGSHPFCDLLSLIEHRDDIDDARWEELESSITRSFGKALTIAATRGKLMTAEPPSKNSAPPSNPAPSGKETMMMSMAEATAEAPAAPAPSAPLAPSPHPKTDGRITSTRTYTDDRTEMDISIQDGEAIPEQDPSTLRRPLPDDPWRRSPLTALQETELLAHSSGVAILFGSHIAGLDDIERFLDVAARDIRLVVLDTATDRTSYLRELDGLLEDRPDGTILVVIPVLVPWSEEWILRTLELVKRKAVGKKMTRVLFLADPEAAWSWVRMDDDLRGQLRRDGLVESSLLPWSNSALRAWLKDVELIDSDPYIAERISRVTGNWGELIQQVGQRCQSDPDRWANQLGDFEKELRTRHEWEDRLGFVAQAKTVLQAMAQMTQPVTSDKLAAKLEGTARDRVEAVLRWADLLNYIHRAGHQLWSLDPVVRQVVLQGD